jgi:hypothetical protein
VTDRPPLLGAALARVGTGAAFTRIVEETPPMPPRVRNTETEDEPAGPPGFTLLESVAADAGVADDDVTRYQEVEDDAGTGLLPPAEWAERMGHPAPDPAALLAAGVLPGQPVTWLIYDAHRTR